VCEHVEIVSVEEVVLINNGVVEGEKWWKGCIGFFDVVKVDVECTASIGDVVDGGGEARECLDEVGMVGVEDNLVFVVVSVCPSVVCEEVLYVCGRILEGRVGKIEGGRHGVRGVLACLVWCSCMVRPLRQIYFAARGYLHVSSLNK